MGFKIPGFSDSIMAANIIKPLIFEAKKFFFKMNAGCESEKKRSMIRKGAGKVLN